MIIWIFTNPDQAQDSFDQWVQFIQTKLGYDNSPPTNRRLSNLSGEFF